MTKQSLNIAKIKAYDDIKRMVRFLQEEQAALDKSVNKREFFRKNLETIYDTNFKNKIPIEEFESIIFDFAGYRSSPSRRREKKREVIYSFSGTDKIQNLKKLRDVKEEINNHKQKSKITD